MASVALVTVHGMGDTPRNYADELFTPLSKRLGANWGAVDPHSVYYQDILQPNEQFVWNRTVKDASVHYDGIRKFMLFGFGDAAGLENRKEDPGSVYEQAQARIANALLSAYANKGPKPVCFVAHSLGCQVLSNYLYDAQTRNMGIWRNIDDWAANPANEYAPHRPLTAEEKKYLSGAECMALMTTGCNIPIFVAAHLDLATQNVEPIKAPNDRFRWLNLYDPDDVLGWPLAPLYGQRPWLEDRTLNAGHGLQNFLLRSWNPTSHTVYWTDDDVVIPIADKLRGMIR